MNQRRVTVWTTLKYNVLQIVREFGLNGANILKSWNFGERAWQRLRLDDYLPQETC